MGSFPFAPSGTLTPTFFQQLGGAHSARLQGWFASAARRQTARSSIVIMGDSVTAGQGATAFGNSYAQLLPAQLRARFPTPGTAGGGRGFLPPVIPPTNPTTFTPPYIALAGATVAQLAAGALAGFGPNLVTYDLSVQGGVTLTYTLNGDSADIIWASNPGNGTFNWKVDAGATTPVPTNAAFNVGNVTHVALGAAGAHTLTIAFVSGAPVYVTGVVEYNGDFASGVQVHGLGYYGSTSAFWTPAGAPGQAAALVPLAPGLIILELGLNDLAAGITPAQSQANLAATIAGCRAALPSPAPPFLLLPTYNAASDGPTTPAQWAQYVNGMYAAAAADTLGRTDVLDLSLRMPSTGAAVTWSLYAGDGIHPLNAGHQMIADALTDFLSPA